MLWNTFRDHSQFTVFCDFSRQLDKYEKTEALISIKTDNFLKICINLCVFQSVYKHKLPSQSVGIFSGICHVSIIK